PDGKRILTGSTNINPANQKFLPGEVRLWDAAAGLIGKPWPHAGPVMTVVFSPDGRRALTAGIVAAEPSRTGEARIWDLSTGQPIGPPLKQSAPIWSAAFSPDSRVVMTGSEGGVTQFWLAATGLPLGPHQYILGNVSAVAFSPDGSTALASRTYEQAAASLWQAPHGPADVLPAVRTPNPTGPALPPRGPHPGPRQCRRPRLPPGDTERSSFGAPPAAQGGVPCSRLQSGGQSSCYGNPRRDCSPVGCDGPKATGSTPS